MIRNDSASAPLSAREGGGTTLLAIEYLTQLPYDQLCWAACCAMVLRANGMPNGQVVSVASAITGAPCDPNPARAKCNQSIDPETALSRLHLPYAVPEPEQGPITAPSITDWIVNGRKPIEVFWRYQDNPDLGHVALIVGFDQASETWCVFDPLTGPGWFGYDYLMTRGDTANWIQSFYAIGGQLGLRDDPS